MMRLWAWIASIAPRGYLAPPATLFAELAYENNEKGLALKGLEGPWMIILHTSLHGSFVEPSLQSGRQKTSKSMRAQLHPKICASLSRYIVNEVF
jgi:hypothetical protein